MEQQALKDLLTKSAQIQRIKALISLRYEYICNQVGYVVADKSPEKEAEMQTRINLCNFEITKLMETFSDQDQEHIRNTYFT